MKIALTHRPIFTADIAPNKYALVDDELYNSVDYIFHGHTHSRQFLYGKNVECGVDCHNFTPQRLGVLVDKVLKESL